MTIHTDICDQLGIEYPIILGGMMGISNGELTAAVSEAGGLGTLSAGTFGPEGTAKEIDKIREATDKPFSVNFPIFHPSCAKIAEVVVEQGVKIVTTAAGSPDKFTKPFKEAGITVMHVVSSVRTAQKAEAAGVDIIVAEGVESGGKVSPLEIPTITLIPQVIDQVKKPVIAAGGIADGRGLLAMLAMGAQGVQIGTSFLCASEAPTHENWRNVLVNAGDDATGVALRNSSPTRIIKNKFFDELNAMEEPGKKAMHYMGIQGQGMAKIPTDTDGTEANYTAGAGAGLIHSIRPAAETVAEIIRDAEAQMAQLEKVVTA